MPVLTSLSVDDAEAGRRLDVYLAESEEIELSRSRIQRLISEGHVTVNGMTMRVSYRVKAMDRVAIEIPDPLALDIKAENIPIDVRYEDRHLLVVNKPRGMVVHPAVGNFSGTLVNALLYHCQDLSGINGVLRPGIVHRLDKDTSGLLMVAKTDQAHLYLAEELKQRRIVRQYSALAHGRFAQDSGTVDAPIARHPRDRQRMAVVRDGRSAITHYQVETRFRSYTKLCLRLETGRTHQIRVHMAYIGHPLVADLKYGHARAELGLAGQFLHAGTLGFAHPATGRQMVFTADLPNDLKAVLATLTEA